MTFLAMIIALVLFQAWGAGNALQQDAWFRGLQSSVRGLGLSPNASLVLYLALPVLLVQVLLASLAPFVFGLAWIAVAAVVLVFSFGRAEYDRLIERYRSYCLAGDFEGAYLFAQSELGMFPDEDETSTPEAIHVAIERELLYLGFERWFAVLFYFLLFGPVGALVYRLLHLSRRTPEDALAARLLYFADWVPVRLLAAVFSLTGDFLGSRDELLASFSSPEQSAGAVLLSVGRAATGFEEVDADSGGRLPAEIAAAETEEIGHLLSRSAGAWLIVISLLELLL